MYKSLNTQAFSVEISTRSLTIINILGNSYSGECNILWNRSERIKSHERR